MAAEYVKLSKIGVAANPVFPTPKPEGHKYGERNPGQSLPIAYHVTGYLVDDVEVGRSVRIIRDSRNGYSASGIMATSPVTAIFPKQGGLRIETENSVYHLDWQPKE